MAALLPLGPHPSGTVYPLQLDQLNFGMASKNSKPISIVLSSLQKNCNYSVHISVHVCLFYLVYFYFMYYVCFYLCFMFSVPCTALCKPCFKKVLKNV